MPVIKVTDMAYSRLKAPDLDKMEEFLIRFGMVRSEGRYFKPELGGSVGRTQARRSASAGIIETARQPG